MTRSRALGLVLGAPVVRRSLMVSLVVGTILNLINQGDALLGGHHVVWWRIALTYCVPYLVASYGAYAALTDSGRGNRS